MSAQVIPFRRPDALMAEPEPVAFAIGARVDLRVGALAAGVVRPRGAAQDAFAFSALSRLLRAARLTWRERGNGVALSLAVPSEIQAELDADLLNEAAIEGGFVRHSLNFELCERVLVDKGPMLAEQLRERGWGVTLRGDEECPLPFGTRARSLYTELVLDAPETSDPYLALEAANETPLGRRIIAAKAAGLVITANSVRSAGQAKYLTMAGFDRGGGPFAEAGLR